MCRWRATTARAGGWSPWPTPSAPASDRLRALAARAEGGLAAWLADLELGEDPAPTEDEAGRVVLATVHRAKGGEWPYVFLVGAEEGLLPHARALRAGGDPSTGPESALAEEARIAYVGLTRPRAGLLVSYCRRRGDRPEPRRLSRFLRELAPGLLEPTG